jgi:6-phosphogluconolactonase/glucosamine-6-phosphate isomerase/deaminase
VVVGAGLVRWGTAYGDVMELRVDDDPSRAAAVWLVERIREAVAERGQAFIAVSGGGTAPPLFEALVEQDVPWAATTIWQVDERVAPDGHPERNAGQLDVLPAEKRPMPVTDEDLEQAAARYGAGLPERFDVVHLGLGDDGHTASWPPGHDVVNSNEPCEAIGEFAGFRRMTLTPPVVNAARARLMLTLGSSKAPLVQRWFAHDAELPVEHVARDDTWVFLDPDAAADLDPSAAEAEHQGK